MVGRRRELEALQLALRGALRGTGSVVFIGGEPGIGKSRLVRELMLAARDTFAVHTGDCFEGEHAMPYRPWLEVLQSMGAGGPSGAPGIVDLIAALSAPSDSRGDDDEDDLERLKFFDGVLGFLRGAAETRPVVMVLEDLHWADPSTIGLLRHVARRASRLPLVIVVTYRTTEVDQRHSLHHVAVEVRERRLGSIFELRGLGLAETTELLNASATALGAPSPDSVAALHVRTDGNPYFLEEILRHLQETDSLAGAADVASVPKGVLEVITRRVGKRSRDCVEALRAAAILGRTFSLDLLSDLAGPDESGVERALREAMSAHLVEELAQTPGQYRFVHALVQEAILATLAPGEAQSLHLKAAESIERRHPGDVDAMAPVLARHYRLAHSPHTLSRLIAAATSAIQAAADSFAWEESRETFEATLAEIEAMGASDLERAAFLGTVLPRTFQRLGFSATSLHRIAEPAAEVLIAHGRGEAAAGLLVVALWTVVVEETFATLDPAKALELIERVRQLSDDQFLHTLCDNHFAWFLMLVGRLDEARHAAETLLESPYPGAQVCGRLYLANYRLYNGSIAQLGDRYASAWEATTVISALAAPAIGASGHLASVWSAAAWWRLRAPSQQAVLLERELELSRQPSKVRRELQIYLAHARRDRGVTAELSSDLRRRSPGAGGWPAVYLFWLDFREGHWDPAFKGLRTALGQTPPELVKNAGMLSELIVEASRHIDPAAAAEFIPEWQFGSHVPLWSVIAHALAGLIAAEMGDFEAVREHAKSARGRMTDDDWFGLGARVELIEAITAQSDRDHEAFQNKFDSAIATMRRVEHPWDESDAHYVLGRVLVRLDRPLEALPYFDEALAILDRIDAAQPFVDRVLAGRRETGAPHPEWSARAGAKKGHGRGELSERELEVLRLLARGLSNRQIAVELVISEATVATHVRHILEKTGSANRTEAAAYAVRNEFDQAVHHPIG